MRLAGVRFWRRKAAYAAEALKNFDIVESAMELDSGAARCELLGLKGLGMKEASHFLRNVGREDVAIIDRHVLRWLRSRGYIEDVKLDNKSYLRYERLLGEIAEEFRVSLAELDLMIWAEMTGKVLK
ncbi:MAG: hypothetical protein ABWW66_00185 [Archaeoglobaceae archaeon]